MSRLTAPFVLALLDSGTATLELWTDGLGLGRLYEVRSEEGRIWSNRPVAALLFAGLRAEADFPQFMGGVKSVTQLDDDRFEWVAEIAGVRRQWTARILEQVPDQKVAWAATEGATNAGAVTFEDVGGGQTSVHLSLEYEPEGLLEKVGDKFNVVENQAEGDLDRFKAFIEAEGHATGAWRGSVNEGAGVGTPGMAEAGSSRGDAGKAGVSGKAVAAGLGAAAAVAVGAAAAAKKKPSADDDTDDTARMDVGAPLAAMPTETGPEETDPLDREDVTYGGGAAGSGDYNDRSDNVAYPPDNTLGQPGDPDRT